jgi:hypothetical protein
MTQIWKEEGEEKMLLYPMQAKGEYEKYHWRQKERERKRNKSKKVGMSRMIDMPKLMR